MRNHLESSECCFACRFSIGVGGTAPVPGPLYCKLHRQDAEGWGCARFEREAGADFPSEWEPSRTVIYLEDLLNTRPPREPRRQRDDSRRRAG